MLAYVVAAWLVAVKWPLTLIINALGWKGVCRRAAAAFEAWACEAAAGGPERIAAAIKARVAYHNDPWRGVLDHVLSPEVTWARRLGDCDDFAYIAAETLRFAGVESWIATYFCWKIQYSHVVCLFRDDGGFGLIDQGLLVNGLATLEEAARAGRPPAKVAAQYLAPYGRGLDRIGRWITSRPPP